MTKTKFGLSTGLTAAIIFMLAIITEFVNDQFIFAAPFVALVAFVLLKEEDLWLKACAVKAVLIVIVFTLVPFLFSFINDFLYFLNFFLKFAGINIQDGFDIMGFIKSIIYVFEKIFLILLALVALKGKTIKVPVIDNIIAKHLSR